MDGKSPCHPSRAAAHLRVGLQHTPNEAIRRGYRDVADGASDYILCAKLSPTIMLPESGRGALAPIALPTKRVKA